MRQEWYDFLFANKGKVIGAIAGILIGLIYLIVGFFKTLVFVILVGLGYYIGTKIDKNEDIRELIERFLPAHWR